MKHKTGERYARAEAFLRMVRHHPPEMPPDFSHRQYRLMPRYARCAFNAGWNSGEIFYRDRHTEAVS